MPILNITGSPDTGTVADNGATVVTAAGGTQTVRIQAGVTGVILDANAERVEVAGNIADYQLVAVPGVGLQLQTAAGDVVATFPSLNNNVTMAFADGSAVLAQTGANDYTLGGSPIAVSPATPTDFTVVGLGANFDANDKSTLTGGSTGTVDGSTFTLTTGNDTGTDFFLTQGNDTIDGTQQNTLNTGDKVTDPSITDADVLNANITGGLVAPDLSNIETININDKFGIASIDAANIEGTKELTVSSDIDSAGLTVDNLDGDDIGMLTTGANVKGITVENMEDLATVNLSAEVTSLDVQAKDDTESGVIKLNGADFGFKNGGTEFKELTMESGTSVTPAARVATGPDDSVVELTGGDLFDETAKLILKGDQTITLKGSATEFDDAVIEDTITGTDKESEIWMDVIDGDADLDAAAVDNIRLDGAVSANATIKVNVDNSRVSLEDGLDDANVITLDVSGNSNGDDMVVSADGAKEGNITITNNVGDLIIIAETDTTLDELDYSAADGTTVTVLENEDLTIKSLAMDDLDTFDASNLKGALDVTIEDGTDGFTIKGGSGNDFIKSIGQNSDGDKVFGNDGDDKIQSDLQKLSEATGGAGKDIFILGDDKSVPVIGDAGIMTIKDFTIADDDLNLEAAMIHTTGALYKSGTAQNLGLLETGLQINADAKDLDDGSVLLLETTDISLVNNAKIQSLFVAGNGTHDAAATVDTGIFQNQGSWDPNMGAIEEHIFLVGETSGTDGVKIFYVLDGDDTVVATTGDAVVVTQIGFLEGINISGMNSSNFDFTDLI